MEKERGTGRDFVPILGHCYCGKCRAEMVPTNPVDSEWCSCPNRCEGWIDVAPEDCLKMYAEAKP
jgi:hypothetical protein